MSFQRVSRLESPTKIWMNGEAKDYKMEVLNEPKKRFKTAECDLCPTKEFITYDG